MSFFVNVEESLAKAAILYHNIGRELTDPEGP